MTLSQFPHPSVYSLKLYDTQNTTSPLFFDLSLLPSQRHIKECKYKYGNADIAVHVEKGKIEL